MNFTNEELEHIKTLVVHKLSYFQSKRDSYYNDIICKDDMFGNCEVNYEKACKKCELYEGILKKLVNFKNK